MTDGVEPQPVKEIEHRYSALSSAGRDELLQELLVAAAHGGKAMVRVIEAWLLDAPGQELLRSLDEPE